MSANKVRLHSEKIIKSDLQKRLMPLFVLLERTEELLDRTIDLLSNHPLNGSATKVIFFFITRLENEIRACSLLSQSGYGLQALVNASTIIEVVGAISYVNHDENRAILWAKHVDKKKSFPPRAKDGIDAALAALGISDTSAKKSWHEAYTFVCMAKHINPLLSMNYGLRMFPTSETYIRGPDNTDLGILLSAEALYDAVFFGTAGIYVVSTHCSDAVINNELQTEAIDILKHLNYLDPWFREATRIKPSDISPEMQREYDKRLVDSLENATKALNKDTKRIRLETELLNKENEKNDSRKEKSR